MRVIDRGFFGEFGKRILGQGGGTAQLPERQNTETNLQLSERPNAETNLQPLVLAYLGDSVFELYVRSMVAHNVGGSVHKLHTEATKHVRCESQADILHSISGILSDKEKDIVRRGRNAHSGFVPKNADVTDYRHATGFEALLGYLFINGDFDRLSHIIDLAFKRVAGRAGEK